MQKAFDLVLPSRIQKNLSSDHIGMQERGGIMNGTIDMRFSREVDNVIHLPHKAVDQGS